MFGNTKSTTKFLLSGALRNSEIKLWSVSTWKCLQTIRFNSPSEVKQNAAFHFALDATASFLFLAHTQENFVYALHIASPAPPSRKSPRVNTITAFELSFPILSFMVTNHERSGSKHHATTSNFMEMQLYCVQTKAIQFYHVNSEQCYLPPTEAESEEDQEPEDQEAQEPDEEEEEEVIPEEATVSSSSPTAELHDDTQPLPLSEQKQPEIVPELTEPDSTDHSPLTTTVQDHETPSSAPVEEARVEEEEEEEVAAVEEESYTPSVEPANETTSQQNLELLPPSSFTTQTNEETKETEVIPEKPLESTEADTKSSETVLQLIEDLPSKQSKKDIDASKNKSVSSKSKSRSRKQKTETAKEDGKTKSAPITILTKPKPDAVSTLEPPADSLEAAPTALSTVSPTKHRSKKDKNQPKEEKKEEKKDEAPSEVPSNSDITPDLLILQELRKLENSVSARTERAVQQQVDRLCILLLYHAYKCIFQT